MIHATEAMLKSLRSLMAEQKFVEEQFYPGAPTEEIRLACEQRVNFFLSDTITLLQRGLEIDLFGQPVGTSRSDLFIRAHELFRSFDREETEEREKVGDYVDMAMRIVGAEDWVNFV